MRISKTLIFIFTLAVLSGCASNPPYLIEDTTTSGSMGSSASVSIVDQRPQSDKEYSFGSFLVTSSNYGIWTLGDEQFSPALLDLLKMRVHREISAWDSQPQAVTINLERMIVQSNQQADLLQGVSTGGGLGPLGVKIAETLHGKDFELDYDKTRPFIIGFIDASVELSFAGGIKSRKKISTSRIENFTHHLDHPGREAAAKTVVTQLMDGFSKSLMP